MKNFYKYFININGTLSPPIIDKFLRNFVQDLFEKIYRVNNNHLLMIVKVRFEDDKHGYKSLTPLRRVNY